MDFIYERFKIARGVKLEIITGGASYSGKVWREIAMQIYCENGKTDYRQVGHFASGAPFLYDSPDETISISHTEGCLVVATANKKAIATESIPGIGVDVERADREKVVSLAERFLTETEMKLLSRPLEVEQAVVAWTCKEAMLKAGGDPDINWRDNITLLRLPSPDAPGEGVMKLGDREVSLRLELYPNEDFLITVAYSLA